MHRPDVARMGAVHCLRDSDLSFAEQDQHRAISAIGVHLALELVQILIRGDACRGGLLLQPSIHQIPARQSRSKHIGDGPRQCQELSFRKLQILRQALFEWVDESTFGGGLFTVIKSSIRESTQ